MKRHSVLFFAVVLGLCRLAPSAFQAWSQEQPGAAAEQELQKLRKVLNLSPAQESQLEPILQAEIPKIEAIKNNPSLSGQEKVKQVQALQSQTGPQVKAILNPTQYKQWESIRQDEINQIKEEKK
jgi:hypothetical protein